MVDQAFKVDLSKPLVFQVSIFCGIILNIMRLVYDVSKEEEAEIDHSFLYYYTWYMRAIE